jgi:putative membrane protein
LADDASTELSRRRTGMSFQRTRMSADRTLMSVIRTAISLIGFGFTIFQFFQKMKTANVIARANAPRNSGWRSFFSESGCWCSASSITCYS